MNSNFSVLMSFYKNDNPRLFKNALDSVFKNSILPTEFVLIQDGPVDDDLTSVVEIFKNFPILKLIKLKHNHGLANALNIGLSHVKCPYVFRADADDYNLPDRFEKQLKYLEQGYDLVGSSILEINLSGVSTGIRRVPTSQDKIREVVRYRNPFNHMTVAFKTEAVINVGGYPNIHLKEDYALWAKMISCNMKVVNLDDILVHATAGIEMYRRRGGLKYVKSEIDMQKFLIKNNLQTYSSGFFLGLARSSIFLMPALLRGFFYEKFLRKSSQLK